MSSGPPQPGPIPQVIWNLGSVAEWAPRGQPAGDQEWRQLAAIRSAQRRSQFLAGRTLTRQLLREWHACAGLAEWSIEPDAAGRPWAVKRGSTPDRLHLSISHSGDWVACAVANHPVGVDIEAWPPRRRRNLALLMQGTATADEWTRWVSLDPESQVVDFHRSWVIKEAWLKSRGQGATAGRLRQLHTRPATPADQHATLFQQRAGSLLACHCDARALGASPPFASEPEQMAWWAVDDLATP